MRFKRSTIIVYVVSFLYPNICLSGELHYNIYDVSSEFDARIFGADRDVIGIRLGDSLSDAESILKRSGYIDCKREEEFQTVSIHSGINVGRYSTDRYAVYVTCDQSGLPNKVFDSITLMATSPATGGRVWYIGRLQNFEDIDNSPDAKKMESALQEKYKCTFVLPEENNKFVECLEVLDRGGNRFNNYRIFSLKSGREFRKNLLRDDVGYVFNSFVGFQENLSSRAKSYSVRLASPALSIADKAALKHIENKFIAEFDGVQATPKGVPLDTPKL